jgi:hypothetical protein
VKGQARSGSWSRDLCWAETSFLSARSSDCSAGNKMLKCVSYQRAADGERVGIWRHGSLGAKRRVSIGVNRKPAGCASAFR